MWPWGRDKGYDSSMEGDSMSGPQLPSAGAMSDGMSADPYNYNAPPSANPYDQTNMGGAPANAYPQPGGYPTGPPANAYGTSATASAAGMPGYGAAAQTAAVAPQTGPYDQNYGQATADPANHGQPAANPYAQPAADPYGAPANAQAYDAPDAAAYPATPPAAANYPTVSPSAAGANPGAVVTNPYATGATGQVDNYAGTAPAQTGAPAADPYASTAQPAADQSQAAYGDTAAGQPPLDRYATSGSENAAASSYPPAGAGYSPGNTGYSPPGVAPYQTASADTGTTAARRDPYYRPGSTSDYLPSSNSQSTAGAAPADRYGTPSTATAPGWPQGY